MILGSRNKKISDLFCGKYTSIKIERHHINPIHPDNKRLGVMSHEMMIFPDDHLLKREPLKLLKGIL